MYMIKDALNVPKISITRFRKKSKLRSFAFAQQYNCPVCVCVCVCVCERETGWLKTASMQVLKLVKQSLTKRKFNSTEYRAHLSHYGLT